MSLLEQNKKGKRARFPFLFSPRDESEVEWMRMTKHVGDLVPSRFMRKKICRLG